MNTIQALFANLKTDVTLDVDKQEFTLTITGEGIYTHLRVVGEDIYGSGDWWHSVKIGEELVDLNVWVEDLYQDANKNKTFITFYPLKNSGEGYYTTDTDTFVTFSVHPVGNISVYNG
jgi:hypothetical protein